MSITGIQDEETDLFLKKEVLRIEGVITVYDRFDEAIIEVKYDNALVNYNFIREVIEKIGYRVV